MKESVFDGIFKFQSAFSEAIETVVELYESIKAQFS